MSRIGQGKNGPDSGMQQRLAPVMTAQSVFFYGTLCHPPLLQVVLGREVQPHVAWLADHSAVAVSDGLFPMIIPQSGSNVQGLLVADLSEADLARLDFYEWGFVRQRQIVQTVEGAQPAQVYHCVTKDPVDGAPWSLAEWQGRYGAMVTATAADAMAFYGQKPAKDVMGRFGQMMVHGASRLRAAGPAPTRLRRQAQTEDVQVIARRQPYGGFFAIEEYELRHRRFDGGFSPELTRACFISGDAVTVLPYDPLRDRVLLIEQFRTAPFARGAREAWTLEAIAGRIDPGETAEAAARREAEEEAQLQLGELLSVAQYYPSPGAVAEYLYSFVALADLPDGVAGVFGLAGEAEDIKGHLIAFDELMALVASGEVNNAPLILTAYWLQRERPRLKATV
jgi:ADP-ribose pyrophosphatase